MWADSFSFLGLLFWICKSRFHSLLSSLAFYGFLGSMLGEFRYFQKPLSNCLYFLWNTRLFASPFTNKASAIFAGDAIRVYTTYRLLLIYFWSDTHKWSSESFFVFKITWYGWTQGISTDWSDVFLFSGWLRTMDWLRLASTNWRTMVKFQKPTNTQSNNIPVRNAHNGFKQDIIFPPIQSFF